MSWDEAPSAPGFVGLVLVGPRAAKGPRYTCEVIFIPVVLLPRGLFELGCF